MDFFDLTKIRTSSRKFTQEQITEEQLQQIVDAGRRAPIGSSRFTDIHLTVVQNPEILKKLAEAARVRRMDLKEMEKIIANVANRDELLEESLDFDPFYQAPTVIFVSHRKQDLEPGIEFSNVSCVTNYMQLAALNLGLGSCFMWYALDSMRRLPELDHSDVLQLPDDFQPLLGLAVGNIAQPLQERHIDLDRIPVDILR